MSVGIHGGELAFFLVGDPTLHRELIVCGPTATRTAQIESAARRDEIRLSPETAELLPAACVERDGALALLTDAPDRVEIPLADDLVNPVDADLTEVLSPPIREYLLADELSAEHRKTAVAFVRFSGTDDLLRRHGAKRLTRGSRRLRATSSARDATARRHVPRVRHRRQRRQDHDRRRCAAER